METGEEREKKNEENEEESDEESGCAVFSSSPLTPEDPSSPGSQPALIDLSVSHGKSFWVSAVKSCSVCVSKFWNICRNSGGYDQCCGSGSGWSGVLLPDPDPDRHPWPADPDRDP